MNKALELLKKYGHHFNYHTANITMKDIDEAIAGLEEQEAKSCEWKECDTEYDTSWGGSCGAKWTIEHGTPQENHMNFCPQCGGKIIHIYPKDTK